MKLKMLVLSGVVVGSVNAEIVRDRHDQIRVERLRMGEETEQHGSAPLHFDNAIGEAADQMRDARRHDQKAYGAMKRYADTGKPQRDSLKKDKKSLAKYNKFEKGLNKVKYAQFKDERGIGVRGERDTDRFSGREYLNAVARERSSGRR